jgi:membrane associated rhomboid family serine protease
MSFYRQGPYRPTGGNLAVPQLTPFVKYIIIACVVMYLVQFVADGQGALSMILGLVPYSVVGLGPLPLPFLWQPFTYMFLHAPPPVVMHILFNMLILWMFGSELEGRWGSRAFLRYYLVCGVGAGIFATVLGLLLPWGQPGVPTIGASGAIYGLMIAYGIIFANRPILFMLIFPMKARTFAWILFAGAFLMSLEASPGRVSHVAHLGGALTGYLYLKKAWRIGDFYREMRWKVRRRRFKVMPPDDPDHWVN